MENKYWEDLGLLTLHVGDERQRLIDLLNTVDINKVDTEEKEDIFPIISIIFKKIHGPGTHQMGRFDILDKEKIYSQVDSNDVLTKLIEFHSYKIDVSYFKNIDMGTELIHKFCSDYIIGLIKK